MGCKLYKTECILHGQDVERGKPECRICHSLSRRGLQQVELSEQGRERTEQQVHPSEVTRCRLYPAKGMDLKGWHQQAESLLLWR